MNFKNCSYTIAFSLLLVASSIAQHTFSIVAIDTLTGEIGSAGATCGDSIIWPGTPGAYIISDIIPAKGAIHTQSYWYETNQINARNELQKGLNAKELITWLEKNDAQNNPSLRQYGVVTFFDNEPMAAAYTGSNCMDYKNHLVGRNYAIQGNILLGAQVLDSMEARFLREDGSLANKLMAAMQGANIAGADSRCLSEGTSSLSAFIRLAKPTDEYNQLYMDINVAGTAKSEEPIDVLQSKFNKWAANNIDEINLDKQLKIYPNPTNDLLNLQCQSELKKLGIYNMAGQLLFDLKVVNKTTTIDLGDLAPGIYFIGTEIDNVPVAKKIVIR